MTSSDSASKPPTTADTARELVRRLYPNLTVASVKELVSYDDRNYLLSGEDGEKYLLKITNSVDSAMEGMLEGQNSMLLHIHARHSDHLQVPRPICNVHGAYITREALGPSGALFAVRLLTFVPGTRLVEHTLTSSLLRQAGSYLGRLQSAINDGGYQSPVIRDRKYLWCLESVPQLHNYLYVFNEQPQKRSWAQKAVEDFEAKVVAVADSLPKAYIHGDFNEQNILVDGEGQVGAVIDFGDICYVPRVFDVAIAIIYMMLLDTADVDPVLDGPAYVLSGFLQHVKLTSEEIEILLICAKARLAQSLTLGAYAYSQQPGNEYLLTTQKKGWLVMERLAGPEGEGLVERWMKMVEGR